MQEGLAGWKVPCVEGGRALGCFFFIHQSFHTSQSFQRHSPLHRSSESMLKIRQNMILGGSTNLGGKQVGGAVGTPTNKTRGIHLQLPRGIHL